ncbi:hypothetical protein LshimejAT787_0403590 [Lyophyllum shimeji]|uniref:Uncharacterized protein n=1 Tax=Lyophyllum shimeji TaxID=47721 RepID=A0A9P3PKV2_LYOSH|nr:hypothetical protein LshimejAT787_0403590 [Lyophyllum shimeji]
MDKEDAEHIDGLPVCPQFDTMPSDVRFLMGYAYGKIALRTKTSEGVPGLHWPATVALLHLSHRLDLVTLRKGAINALKLLFPRGRDYDPIYPAIAGVKHADRQLFPRLFPYRRSISFANITCLPLCPWHTTTPRNFQLHTLLAVSFAGTGDQC